MWSVGVVLYVLLCGYTPFMEENQDKMFERIKQSDYSFDPEDWGNISTEAIALIKSLMEPNPDQRMTAARALKSKWIKKDSKELSSRDLSQGVLSLKEKRPRLRDLARAFMAIGGATKKALGDLNPIQSETGSHQLI
jgi:serine/threonine protein kinase